MVFVHVHRGPPAIEPTPEEAALLRELEQNDPGPEALEGALTARGVDPERARALSGLVAPRSVAEQLRAAGATIIWVAVAIAFGAGRRPLKQWLHAHYPGSEWLVEVVLPVAFGLAVLWSFLSRMRAAGDAPQSGTRADKIDNKPIG